MNDSRPGNFTDGIPAQIATMKNTALAYQKAKGIPDKSSITGVDA
jgi:hypothetical protein